MLEEEMLNLIRATKITDDVPVLPKNLFHYCSMETFSKILSSKQLFLTHFEYLNDYMDSRWIYQFVEEQLKSFSDRTEIESFTRFLNLNDTEKYVACFSEDGDILSQWRAYGADGAGIAIGFSTELMNIPSQFPHINELSGKDVGIVKINYDKKSQEWSVKTVLNFGSNVPDEVKLPPIAAQGFLSRLALIAKNHKFFEEREWRITKVTQGGGRAPYFRSIGDRLIPYHVLGLSSFPNMAIGALILGPKNKSSISDILEILNLHGVHVSDEIISRSEATYH